VIRSATTRNAASRRPVDSFGDDTGTVAPTGGAVCAMLALPPHMSPSASENAQKRTVEFPIAFTDFARVRAGGIVA